MPPDESDCGRLQTHSSPGRSLRKLPDIGVSCRRPRANEMRSHQRSGSHSRTRRTDSFAFRSYHFRRSRRPWLNAHLGERFWKAPQQQLRRRRLDAWGGRHTTRIGPSTSRSGILAAPVGTDFFSPAKPTPIASPAVHAQPNYRFHSAANSVVMNRAGAPDNALCSLPAAKTRHGACIPGSCNRKIGI
jgi:hypothetical protein